MRTTDMSESASSSIDPSIGRLRIGGSPPLLPVAFGGSLYTPASASGTQEADFAGAIAAAYDAGIRHFDTAAGYAGGRSEEIYSDFIASRRGEIFLASKANPADPGGAAMAAAVEDSLRRLKTDHIDLYYIHWPRGGADMRPRMEALEAARRAGKIGAVGVSNFSVADMRQVQEAGRIDAHQLGYNLLWRHAEREVIPFCAENGIAVVAYSTLAHGILTGKFGPTPDLSGDDQRHRVLPFRADIWPHVHSGVDELKGIASEVGSPLAHLAIRWSLARPGIDAVVVGARSRAQCAANLAALGGALDQDVFDRMTAISDVIAAHVPDEGNLFDYRP